MSEEVTYGNFRRPKVPGLGGLSLGVTVILGVGCFIAMIVTVILGRWLLGVGMLAFLAVVAGTLLIPTRDRRNVYAMVGGWLVFRRARARRWTELRQGPVGFVPGGKTSLPGVAADTDVGDFVDAYGTPFGIIRHRKTHHYTIVFECHAAGISGVDQGVIEGQVASFGAFLGSLGREGAGIVGAQICVETVPDSGERLRRAALTGIVPEAPTFSVEILRGAADTYPVGSAQISTRVSVTVSATLEGMRSPRREQEVVADISSRIPTLLGRLRTTGAGATARAATAQEIIDSTRAAYDPSAATDIEIAKSEGGTGLTWEEAGPLSADAEYESYRHDGARSISWVMVEPPRGSTYAVTLLNLVAPHPDIARKRVTLLYRFEDPVSSAQAVEADVNLAQWSATQGSRMSARGAMDIRAAQQTAREEALGASLVRFGLIATATVMDDSQVPIATQTMRTLGATARLKLRLARGAQDTTFVAGLPLGVVLQYRTALPPQLGDIL